MDAMKQMAISIINRRLKKIDGSTYSDALEIAKATAVVDELTTLRQLIDAIPEPKLPHACQNCGGTTFKCTIGGEGNSMICSSCGKEHSGRFNVV